MAEVTLPGAAGGVSPAVQRAGLTAGAVFVLLAAVLYTNAPSILPGYPAIVVSFAVWLIVPGWALQRALAQARSPVEQVLASFLCSVALSALPGLAALRWHWSLEQFALAYAFVAALASGAAVLLAPDERPEEEPDEGASLPGKAALLLLIALPLLAIASSPWWGGDLIARDADDWVYMTYVNEYLHEDALNADDVAAGSGSFQRMLTNVWVVHEALLADSAGVAPYDTLMTYLPPVLSILAVGATFVLARGLFKNSMIALLAAGFHVGYAVLDLSAHEGFGRNVLLRITEDKMVATFVLLPVAMLYAVSFVARTQVRHLALALLAGLALFVVHPASVIYLAAPLGAFAVLRAAVERSPRPLIAGAIATLPLALLGGLSFEYLSQEETTAVAAAFDPRLLFREELHIVDVGGGYSTANFHIILHPLMLAALALAPLVWLVRRRSEGGQYVLASSLAVLFLLFVAPVTTELGERFSWNAVWRLPWVVPVAMTLAAAAYEGVRWLSSRPAFAAPRWQAALPAGALVLVLGAGMIVLEQYARADDGVYYARTSSSAWLPGTDASITLGGIDRAFSGDNLLTDDSQAVISFLRERVPRGSTVLADAAFGTYLPATLEDIEVYAALSGGTPEELETQRAFYAGEVDREALAAELGTLGIDYVLVQTGTPADDALRPPFAVYSPEDLMVSAGEPEEIAVGEGSLWALPPDARSRLAAEPFTVPQDLHPSNPRLEFETVIAAPASGTARIVVSFRMLPAAPSDEFESAVTDWRVEPNASFHLRRSPRTEVSPGARYELNVWRQGDAPEDTLDAEVYLGGLAVRYWPVGLEQAGSTGFYLAPVHNE